MNKYKFPSMKKTCLKKNLNLNAKANTIKNGIIQLLSFANESTFI